jgi:hypothetical protein
MLLQISVLSSNSIVPRKKKRKSPTGGWLNMQNEGLYIPPNITDYTKKDEMDGACRARREGYKRLQNCG